jgi:hypothetical protein
LRTKRRFSISPNPDHDALVNRALRRKKPFSRYDSGYRDALIWETIRELAAEERGRIVFVTEDDDAFHGSSENPHPQLAEVLPAAALVAVEKNLETVVKQYIPREALIQSQTKEGFAEESVGDQLSALIVEQLPGVPIDRYWLQKHEPALDDESDLTQGERLVWADIEAATVTKAHRIEHVNVFDAREIGTNEIAASLQILVDADVEVEIRAGLTRVEGQNEPVFAILPPEDRDREASFRLYVSAEALFNPATKVIAQLTALRVGHIVGWFAHSAR